MALPLLPTPPSRADSASFAARADAFFAALPAWQIEFNAMVPAAVAGSVTGTLAVSGNALVGTAVANTTPAGDDVNNMQWAITGARGRLLVQSNDNTGGTLSVNNTFADTSSRIVVQVSRRGSGVGSITASNTATAYNTSSDYRLKASPVALTGSGAFIDALRPKAWSWVADGTPGVGFIAHEVAAVAPGSVSGEKDAVDEDGQPIHQVMEYGSAEFIAHIVAELQSLRVRVAELEAAG
jgi:hypothetical protein